MGHIHDDRFKGTFEIHERFEFEGARSIPGLPIQFPTQASVQVEGRFDILIR